MWDQHGLRDVPFPHQRKETVADLVENMGFTFADTNIVEMEAARALSTPHARYTRSVPVAYLQGTVFPTSFIRPVKWACFRVLCLNSIAADLQCRET